jgi:hypothetical protein
MEGGQGTHLQAMFTEANAKEIIPKLSIVFVWMGEGSDLCY